MTVLRIKIFLMLTNILSYYVQADNAVPKNILNDNDNDVPKHILNDNVNDVPKHILNDMINKIAMLSQKYDQLQDKSIQQHKLIDTLNSRVIFLEKDVAKLSYYKKINEGNLKVSVRNNTVEERISHLEELAKTKVLRTCAELYQYGVRISGHYNIDPDGENIGLPPIKVYCDFEKLTTEIIHDSDNELIAIPHCTDGQCFKKQFNYKVPMDQIISLIQLSSSCSQSFVFDCFLAPLSYNNIQIGSWTDRSGEDQVYFSGANYGQHMCSCYNNNTCADQQVYNTTCNCDATAITQWMEDSGIITNKTALPITSFNYGPLEYETQEAKVMIGRLKCSGVGEINSPPISCNDLKKSGVIRAGLYPLYDAENGLYPKLSYCDMDIEGYEDDLETSGVWFKFSSGPGNVVFAVQHHGKNDIAAGSTITYDIEVLNVGNCMNKGTGIFVAKTAGIYEFSFSGLRYIGALGSLRVDVYLNGDVYAEIYGETGSEEVSKTWILNLEYGDAVLLVLKEGGLHGAPYYSEFTGKLI